MKKQYIIIICMVLSSSIFSQNISDELYKNEIIHEDFNQMGENFPIITTSDNYFIIDKGDYLLSRNNEESEYAIISKNSTASDFMIRTGLRIGPSKNKKASVGLILKAQENGKGAIIFEINKRREYRIKQLNGSSYKMITGNNKNNGWIKNNVINGTDERNAIEIRSDQNIYDIYVNNKYLNTFFIPDFNRGSFGLIISPETKARISYFYLNTKQENTNLNNSSILIKKNKTDNTISEKKDNQEFTRIESDENLYQKIALLEDNNAKLNAINQESINNKNNIINGLEGQIKESEKSNKELENKISELNKKIQKLNQKNSELADVSIEQEREIKQLEEKTNKISQNKNDEISKLSEKINNLNKENEKIQSLEDNKKESESFINILMSEKDQLSNKIIELQEKTNKFIESNNKQVDKIKNLEEKNKDLSSVSIEQEKKIKEKEDLVNSQKQEISKYIEDNKKLNSSLSQSSNDLNKYKNQSAEYKSKLDALNKKTGKEIADLNNKIAKTTNNIDRLNDDNSMLNSKLQDKEIKHKKIREGLSVSIAEKTEEITNLNNKLLALTNQLKSEKRKSRDSEKCDQNLKEVLNKLKNLNKDLDILKEKELANSKIIKDLQENNLSLNKKQTVLEVDLRKNKEENISLKKENNELRDIFVSKDFELNDVKSVKQSIKKPKINKRLNNDKNTIYTVQLGVFMQEQKSTKVNKIDNLWYKEDDGVYIYYSGEYNSIKDAVKAKNRLSSLGFSNANVVKSSK